MRDTCRIYGWEYQLNENGKIIRREDGRIPCTWLPSYNCWTKRSGELTPSYLRRLINEERVMFA